MPKYIPLDNDWHLCCYRGKCDVKVIESLPLSNYRGLKHFHQEQGRENYNWIKNVERQSQVELVDSYESVNYQPYPIVRLVDQGITARIELKALIRMLTRVDMSRGLSHQQVVYKFVAAGGSRFLEIVRILA